MRLDDMLRRGCIAAVFCLFLSPAVADEDEDRADMFDARRSGAILPLAEILERLRPQIGEHIVEVEFKRSHSGSIYEVYYIDENGRRREIEVDAATATVLDNEEDD
jgi:uncharacterized membrane protein YkoI